MRWHVIRPVEVKRVIFDLSRFMNLSWLLECFQAGDASVQFVNFRHWHLLYISAKTLLSTLYSFDLLVDLIDLWGARARRHFVKGLVDFHLHIVFRSCHICSCCGLWTRYCSWIDSESRSPFHSLVILREIMGLTGLHIYRKHLELYLLHLLLTRRRPCPYCRRILLCFHFIFYFIFNFNNEQINKQIKSEKN